MARVLLFMTICAVVSSSGQAEAQSLPTHMGTLRIGETQTGMVRVEEVLEWDIPVQGDELIQLRILGSDGLAQGLAVDLFTPNRETTLPVGGWVEIQNRWGLLRASPGSWLVQLSSSPAAPASYELELSVQTPWPDLGFDSRLPAFFLELSDRSAEVGDWVRSEAQMAASLGTSRAFLGADRENWDRWITNRMRDLMLDSFRRSSEQLASQARRLWLLRDREGAVRELRRALYRHRAWARFFGGDERSWASAWQAGAELVDLMVEFQLTMGRPGEAFLYAEAARARATVAQLVDGSSFRSDPGLEAARDSLSSRRLTLLERLRELPAGASQGGSSSLREAIRDSVSMVENAFSNVYSSLRTTAFIEPGIEPPPAFLEVVQRNAVPDEGALLLYRFGERRSYLFVVPPPGGEIEAHVLRISRGGAKAPLNLRNPRSGSFRSTSEALNGLWRQLIPDQVWEDIRGVKEVVIVPDARIHDLPFEALVTKIGENPEETEFWLDTGPPIRYAVSATALLALQQRPSVRPGGVEEPRLLSIAGPSYRDGGPIPLQLLPATLEESEAVKAAFLAHYPEGEVTTLHGEDATEERARAALASADFAHIATHGFASDQWGGLFASLAFAGTPLPEVSPASGRDGFLQLYEIYGLDLLGLELAVLSACETNVGETWGTSVFTLAGGFLSAGANRVVSSAWAVDDAATGHLVGKLFEEYLGPSGRERIPLSEALRNAKRSVRNNPDWSHPFFWAAFIASGLR